MGRLPPWQERVIERLSLLPRDVARQQLMVPALRDGTGPEPTAADFARRRMMEAAIADDPAEQIEIVRDLILDDALPESAVHDLRSSPKGEIILRHAVRLAAEHLQLLADERRELLAAEAETARLARLRRERLDLKPIRTAATPRRSRRQQDRGAGSVAAAGADPPGEMGAPLPSRRAAHPEIENTLQVSQIPAIRSDGKAKFGLAWGEIPVLVWHVRGAGGSDWLRHEIDPLTALRSFRTKGRA